MNQINRDARLPLYHQLYEILHETILLGKCKPGDRLPTESELLGTYGVSRITVRKILGEIKMQRAKSKNKEVVPATRAFRHCDFSCLIFDIRWGLALIMCVALAGAPARATHMMRASPHRISKIKHEKSQWRNARVAGTTSLFLLFALCILISPRIFRTVIRLTP